jgi:hypothetical protein
VNLGDTFVWSPDERKEHLWIALTDPNKNNGRFAAFNLTRSRGGTKALTFRIGQHRFIDKYDSDVNFGDGLIMTLSKIEQQIAWGQAFPHDPMDAAMLKQIAVMAVTHPAVSEEIQELIKAEWGL